MDFEYNFLIIYVYVSVVFLYEWKKYFVIQDVFMYLI